MGFIGARIEAKYITLLPLWETFSKKQREKSLNSIVKSNIELQQLIFIKYMLYKELHTKMFDGPAPYSGTDLTFLYTSETIGSFYSQRSSWITITVIIHPWNQTLCCLFVETIYTEYILKGHIFHVLVKDKFCQYLPGSHENCQRFWL